MFVHNNSDRKHFVQCNFEMTSIGRSCFISALSWTKIFFSLFLWVVFNGIDVPVNKFMFHSPNKKKKKDKEIGSYTFSWVSLKLYTDTNPLSTNDFCEIPILYIKFKLSLFHWNFSSRGFTEVWIKCLSHKFLLKFLHPWRCPYLYLKAAPLKLVVNHNVLKIWIF